MAINVTKTVKDAYGAFFGNKTLLAIGLIAALITVIVSSAFELMFANFTNLKNNPSAALALIESPAFWIELVVSVAAIVLVGLFMSGIVMSAAAEGDKATIGDAVRNAASRYVSLIGTGISTWVLGFL